MGKVSPYRPKTFLDGSDITAKKQRRKVGGVLMCQNWLNWRETIKGPEVGGGAIKQPEKVRCLKTEGKSVEVNRRNSEPQQALCLDKVVTATGKLGVLQTALNGKKSNQKCHGAYWGGGEPHLTTPCVQRWKAKDGCGEGKQTRGGAFPAEPVVKARQLASDGEAEQMPRKTKMPEG